MDANEIPALREPVDRLRYGNKMATDNIEVHPLQHYLQRLPANEFKDRMKVHRALFGNAAAMRIEFEKDILMQFQRLPGIPSSFLGVHTILNDDDDIDIGDFFDCIAYMIIYSLDDSPNLEKFTVHQQIEMNKHF